MHMIWEEHPGIYMEWVVLQCFLNRGYDNGAAFIKAKEGLPLMSNDGE